MQIRPGRAAALAAAAFLLLVAVSATAAAAHPLSSAVSATAARSPATADVSLSSTPRQCVWTYASLTASPEFSVAGATVIGKRTSSDAPFPCSRLVVLARWAAITDQRRDVLDLARSDVERILRGDLTDWSELGGSAQPIRVWLPASQTAAIAAAFNLPRSALVAETLPDDEIADRVASTPGGFALIEPERLHLGVLALTVDGHDPYRDPARLSPLRLVRWVRAPVSADADPPLDAAPAFDPAGMLVTGELIPVRCTNHVLNALDDYHAMFDGVRRAVRAADIAVAALESPLTERGGPTPCVETVILQGSPRVVPALAAAGLDVILTIGNHMLDCWGACGGVEALYETLERLRSAGIAAAGAGENLSAARAPAVLSIPTAHGPVRFAFLGYDYIAPWYHATDEKPGIAPLDAESVREDIAAALRIADHVIVGANWGVEYTSNPIAFQRDIAAVAVDAGATFLFGNHPHWVQAVEHFDDALVAYSFGNFIFDQDWSIQTTQGMLMELGFTADRLIGYRIRPIAIRAHSSQLPWRYRPDFVHPAAEGRPILTRIWNAQDRLPAR